MKQATGDLNMTIIVVIAVAGLVAFFSMVVWPMVKGGMIHEADCSDAICEKNADSNGMVNCKMKNGSKTFQCPYKG